MQLEYLKTANSMLVWIGCIPGVALVLIQAYMFMMRAWKTLIQSAIGAAATSALTAIGTATTMGDVNWGLVASTACLSAIASLLMNVKANLPELEQEAVDVEFDEDGEDHGTESE